MNCPECGLEIEADEEVACATCLTSFHEDCLIDGQQCPACYEEEEADGPD